ncbi:MAG: prolipoprotein diacylglyceryl transferase, partial [Thermodesulfobacteriota bacterium]
MEFYHSELRTMYPILFRLGSFNVYAYGFFVISGFAIGTLLAIWRGRRKGISVPFERLVDLFFYSVLSAIVGSRVLYVLLNLDIYRKNPLKILNLSEGGLVFYGGLLLALGISFLYMKRHRMPVWKLA